MRSQCGRARPSLVFGGMLVLVGAAFLAENLGLFDFGSIWHYWPVIIIAIGASRIAEAQGEQGKIFGGILVLIGSALLVDTLGIFRWHIGRYWPVILILVGVLFVLRTVEGGRPAGAAGQSISSLNDWTVFGGIEKRIESPEFRGGEIMAVFGGVKLDLSRANLAAPEITIDTNAIFGGIEMRVPDDWTVSIQGQGIFGGYNDKTAHPKYEGSKPPKLLIVKGMAIFGGVEIRN